MKDGHNLEKTPERLGAPVHQYGNVPRLRGNRRLNTIVSKIGVYVDAPESSAILRVI
jgi:hypothetical protein